MPRKAIALATLALFVLVSTGCMTWGAKEINTSADAPRPGVRVRSVVKRSGEVIEFSRDAPARIVGDQVVGTPVSLGERDVAIEGPFPLIKRLADGTVAEVTDAGGRVWSVRKVLKEEPNRMTLRIAVQANGAVAIPLSDIWQVKIKRANAPLTLLAVLSGLGTAFVIAMAISLGQA
jgi:hypothetical protein